MIPGPDQIVACPKCDAIAKYATILSGNNAGATFWTDGRQIAPMLPSTPSVVKCHHCANYYWLADAKRLGRVYDGDPNQPPDPTWTAAPLIRELTEHQYYEAISRGLAGSPKQERALRIYAWWRRNDLFRDFDYAQSMEGLELDAEAWRKNLNALTGVLREDENDQLLKAEVLRELGEFDQAKTVLARVTSPQFSWIADSIRILCGARDANVREVQVHRQP